MKLSIFVNAHFYTFVFHRDNYWLCGKKCAFSSLHYGAIREIGTLCYAVDAIIIIRQAFSYKSHSDNI